MVDEKQVLLIDGGNTRIKYCRLDTVAAELATVSSVEDLISQLIKKREIRYIYLANVGNSNLNDALSNFCTAQSIDLRVIETEKTQFGLINSYANEKKMGVDRWLAMIAAQEMTDKPFAVIDIGTAITCDFVDGGQHLGGWIAPGFTIMRDALITNTVKVTANNTKPEQIMVGQDTEACVAFGCLAAVQGVYFSAIDYLSSKRTDFSIIIGGGDKNMLAFSQHAGSIHVANLVVHGLARYARSELFA
ncbi:type III pantothenate kinase [Alteromonas pelagimontana]|uniref:Type III pantothenate kinase n=1 Tax=Alteromonas pelagimontana TaxID=1858656 RepID=A0A6M4MEC1_9ALTE|nr:type III pantothenate kinase [Alteromonas pelagimontana]QJR81541.1 type III pantothenate kinase [Alteromonas pelagimontana]